MKINKLGFILVFLSYLLPFSSGANAQTRTRTSHAQCGSSPGTYTVSGVVFGNRPQKPVEGITVTLEQENSNGPIQDQTDPEGRYCISFPSGHQILFLTFQNKEGRSCITRLSGNTNHIINKILEDTCPDAQIIVTHVPPKILSELLGKYISREFDLFQVQLTPNADLITISAALDLKNQCSAGESSSIGSMGRERNVVPPSDPAMVALIADRYSRRRLTLLGIGPIGLLTFDIGPKLPVYPSVFQQAFRPNQFVPRNANTVMTLFFPHANRLAYAAGPPSPLSRDLPSMQGSLRLIAREVSSPLANAQERSSAIIVSFCRDLVNSSSIAFVAPNGSTVGNLEQGTSVVRWMSDTKALPDLLINGNPRALNDAEPQPERVEQPKDVDFCCLLIPEG